SKDVFNKWNCWYRIDVCIPIEQIREDSCRLNPRLARLRILEIDQRGSVIVLNEKFSAEPAGIRQFQRQGLRKAARNREIKRDRIGCAKFDLSISRRLPQS